MAIIGLGFSEKEKEIRININFAMEKFLICILIGILFLMKNTQNLKNMEMDQFIATRFLI